MFSPTCHEILLFPLLLTINSHMGLHDGFLSLYNLVECRMRGSKSHILYHCAVCSVNTYEDLPMQSIF